jgi:hypothetical protein
MEKNQQTSGSRRPGAFTRFTRQDRENRESPSASSQRLEDNLTAKLEAAGLSRKAARKEAKFEVEFLKNRLDKDEIDQKVFDDLVEFFEKKGYGREKALEEARKEMEWLSSTGYRNFLARWSEPNSKFQITREEPGGNSYADWFWNQYSDIQ